MPTLLVTHEACLGHEQPAGHPERVDRLRAVLAALDAADFAGLLREEAPRAGEDAIARAHDPALIRDILDGGPATGFRQLDPDTGMSPGSKEAALRAAGAVIHAVDRVMAGAATNAFCAVRPPGHHAEPSRPMGFCLFNNVAIGAFHAQATHGLERVAVVDFDVHHGNGTEACFDGRDGCLYISTHQMPLFPGTGAAETHGRLGNIVNHPLPPGAGSDAFRAAYRDVLIPNLRAFHPEMIFISAGFDGHRRDPLANLELDEADYAWVTGELAALAGEVCGGRIVSALEGGYDLEALAASSAAHVERLMAG